MIVNQWLPAAHRGDAIGDSARRVRGLLRDMGHRINIKTNYNLYKKFTIYFSSPHYYIHLQHVFYLLLLQGLNCTRYYPLKHCHVLCSSERHYPLY